MRYDLIVIGSGPAGTQAAIHASSLGKRVLLVEKTQTVGGVTVHSGTIPSKTLRETILFLSGWRQRGVYQLSSREKRNITVHDLNQRLQTNLSKEVDIIQRQLKRNKVDIAYGQARFIDEVTVSVEDRSGRFAEYEADKMVICVGTKTHRPDDMPFDGDSVIDSDEIINMSRIPQKLLVVGAGVIGLEYATIYRALDIEVTLVESNDAILGFIEKEIVQELVHHLNDLKIKLHLQDRLLEIKKRDDGMLICSLQSGPNICVDTVLFAVGRRGVTDDLGLDRIGIETDNKGLIEVNDNYQTTCPHIYAAGDVIGFPGLTSTSMAQGRRASSHAFGVALNSKPEIFPYGIYALPEIGTVGLTEQQCVEREIRFEAGVARLKETARGQILGLREGMLKMLFASETKELLGVHIIGDDAAELVHIGQAVISFGGTLDYFIETVFNHPTLAEAYKIAALDARGRMNP